MRSITLDSWKPTYPFSEDQFFLTAALKDFKNLEDIDSQESLLIPEN